MNVFRKRTLIERFSMLAAERPACAGKAIERLAGGTDLESKLSGNRGGVPSLLSV